MPTASDGREAALVDFLAHLRFDDLPKETVDGALAVILDHLLCADLGMDQPWVRLLEAQLRDELGEWSPAPATPTAAIYGTADRVPARVAALVNGTASHGLELDDIYHPGLIHPGSCVVPAAIATAAGPASAERGGRDLVTAVVAGYEAIRHICAAVGTRHSYLGFHSTGTIGPFGATVAAGRMVGLDAAGLANSIGIAASFGAGIKAFQNGPGMIKRVHAGRAAESGLLAAGLAGRGFEGPDGALAGRFGFVEVWGEESERDADRLAAGLGEDFIVEKDVYIKPFSTCGAIHGVLLAAADVRRELGDRVGELERVVVGSARRVAEQNAIDTPTDPMTAQYSVQYGVALALLGEIDDLRRFQDPGTYGDPRVRALIDRTKVEVDRRAEEAYVRTTDGRVTCVLRGGERFEVYRSAGPEVSSGFGTVEAKCHRLWERRRTPEQRQNVVHAVLGLADDGPVADIVTALAPTA
ncbi:MmgE/PrpD family protein [Actinophytocola sp.]|uniref:MmgE/PrpD family protein n=1 Tax=Actinophytocola sp. TaxID=1872138 RepID=UPI003D6B53B2